MAQHDYNISNATGANFRADVNSMAQAIVTVNSGATEPAVRFAGMLWLDLSGGGDGVMRRRNQANTAWLTDIGIDQTARTAAAAAQTTANAALPRAGGTMTGAIVLPAAEPTNNQAVSRAWADQLYQVRLPVPVAGSLLVGAAGGWTATLAPGADQAILVTSGGLPVWQPTGIIASPGIVVRTGSDGTIDSSFIPQVASGLKFCGTFKPAVNAEYPTTGGHGAGGAPAIGDFWIIDGLTTGGYTYLTGSLAGVTVYNGDSIAFNGATDWFRMGSTIFLQGYLRTDGTIAMAGNLNMGGFAINNVNGVAGRAGAPVPLSNFKIDATNVVISPQRGASGADLAVLDSGRLATDLGRMQIFVGTSSANLGMLAVRIFSTTAAYAAGDYVVQAGRMYRAIAAVAAGAFVPAQWAAVADGSTGQFLPLTGGTMTGTITSTAQDFLTSNRNGWWFNYSNLGDGRIGLWDNALQTFVYTYASNVKRHVFNGGIEGQNGLNLYTGAVSTQVGTVAAGYADRVTRWLQVLNADASFGWYSYDATGGNGREALTMYTTVAGGSDQIRFRGQSVWWGGNFDPNSKLNKGGDTMTGALTVTSGNYLISQYNGYGLIYSNYGSGQFVQFDVKTNVTACEYNLASGGIWQFRGAVYCVSLTQTSDRRMKRNIETYQPPAGIADNLTLYEYEVIDGGVYAVGLMSDDVKVYAPHQVSTNTLADGTVTEGVNKTDLTLEFIADLAARVRALEAAVFTP